jgi:type II secretory pathway pseudopilin PulG
MIKKNLNPNFKCQKGLTLIELLVSISLFTAAGLLVVTLFINIIRIQGRLNLENAIYEDGRFMMERISRATRNNTIDYEEYFNKAISASNRYGDLFGCYAAQFYNPGQGDDMSLSNAGKLGAYCNDDTAYSGQECVVYKPSVDLNTGLFPYLGKSGSPPASDAFCPQTDGAVCTITTNNSYQRDQLYLINKDGNSKTIFALKKVKDTPTVITPEYALAEVEIQGEDTNHDGVTEKWRGCAADSYCCKSGYTCTVAPAMTSLEQFLNPLAADFSTANIYTGFVPISPLRTSVTGLKFTISPADDPRKAFAKGGASIAQPKVIISLTVQPSAVELAKFGNPSDIPTLTLQTTISSRVQSEVKSYMGSNTYKIGQSITDSPAGWLPSNPASPVSPDGGYCPL